MSAETNKTRTRRIVEEIFNARNIAIADDLFAPDYAEHTPGLPPNFPPGVAGLKLFVTSLVAAFPDFRYTVEDMVAEGETVAARLTARGRHQGAFFGIPATGQAATWTEIHLCRYAGGKLVEHWVNSDQLGLLQQLGVIPVPGQVPA